MMSMTPRERMLAVYNGEEPDKIPVCTYEVMLRENPEWGQRLQKRGLGMIRMAEISAGYPAKFVDIAENMSDMVSPAYYRKYCLPIYEIYSKQLRGTGKILGVHMDGRLGRLKKEVAESPLNSLKDIMLIMIATSYLGATPRCNHRTMDRNKAE